MTRRDFGSYLFVSAVAFPARRDTLTPTVPSNLKTSLRYPTFFYCHTTTIFVTKHCWNNIISVKKNSTPSNRSVSKSNKLFVEAANYKANISLMHCHL